MPQFENRVKVKGSDGKWYWYNANTGKLFLTPSGHFEIKAPFSYVNGTIVFGPGPTDSQPNPGLPQPYGPGDHAPHPPGWWGGGGGDDGEGESPFPDDPCPVGFHLVNEGGSWRCVADDDSFNEDFFQEFVSMLGEWGLDGLADWVRQSIIEGKGRFQILRELRETDIYKAAFPEQELRKKNGFTFMLEGEIIAYRNQARSLIRQVFGYTDIANKDIALLIGNGKSLDEFAHNLQVWKAVQERGPEVKMLFETILGVNLSDNDLREFFDPEISTPELDRAFEDALYRGLPAMLGIGIRPQEEADKLRAFGIDPNKAFAGYQEVAGQLPLFRKLDAIDNALRGRDDIPTGNDLLNDTPLMDLIAGIQYRDPIALARLSNTLQREGARWSSGGGAIAEGGKLIGRLARSER